MCVRLSLECFTVQWLQSQDVCYVYVSAMWCDLLDKMCHCVWTCGVLWMLQEEWLQLLGKFTRIPPTHPPTTNKMCEVIEQVRFNYCRCTMYSAEGALKMWNYVSSTGLLLKQLILYMGIQKLVSQKLTKVWKSKSCCWFKSAALEWMLCVGDPMKQQLASSTISQRKGNSLHVV